MILTVEKLSDLCGFEFDEKDNRRAQAVIELVTSAAAGILRREINGNAPSSIASVIASASMRIMQNKSGVLTETIGSFNAQYPLPGRMFTPEEMEILNYERSNSYGSIPIVTLMAQENYEEN
jgi:hypothetical protein